MGLTRARCRDDQRVLTVNHGSAGTLDQRIRTSTSSQAGKYRSPKLVMHLADILNRGRVARRPAPDAIMSAMVHQEHQRSDAILAFLEAGLHQPLDRALAVTAISNARRELADQQARNQPIDAWLAEQAHYGGIRENAATLVVLELPRHRHEAAHAYSERHPERVTALNHLIDAIR